ncbi:hypothetical protein [Ancylobacter sp. IITR112]|uniref:hypothetical protein n=1 Tax=Ancylobacter sp. IITR112 TaxID=3138073 RepID=UPI00352ADBCE
MSADADRRPVEPNRDARPDQAPMCQAPASAPLTADTRRRAALRQLGKAAAYGLPATLSLMSIRRAAADS